MSWLGHVDASGDPAAVTYLPSKTTRWLIASTPNRPRCSSASIGDQAEAAVVVADRTGLSTDEQHLSVGQLPEHFVWPDCVQRGEPRVKQDSDRHIDSLS